VRAHGAGRGQWCAGGRLGGRPLKGALQCVALGQVLSLLVTVTAVSSSVLASQGVSIPASQSFLNYLLLAAAYGTPLLLRVWRGRPTLTYTDPPLPPLPRPNAPLILIPKLTTAEAAAAGERRTTVTHHAALAAPGEDSGSRGRGREQDKS